MFRWQPTADIEALRNRAHLYKILRQFFESRGVLEVETPILGKATTEDPFIESFSTRSREQARYLQTSPEFFLKRLLASGSGDIYSLSKVFRKEETGTWHHFEFTMLEWYRVGWDEHKLMDEVAELIHLLLPDIKKEKISYRELFLQYLGVDPHHIELEELRSLVLLRIELSVDTKALNADALLDLLMTHCIEPELPEHLLFVYDYPENKAALSELGANKQGQTVARRFETYLKRVELANGYLELTDAEEQRQRVEKNLMYRKQNGFSKVPHDEALIAAMEYGLPKCAGVAMGIDRLLMLTTNTNTIQETISFAE